MIVLCLCGRTASGKTTVARRLGDEWSIVESGKVVADMIESAPIHNLKGEDAKTAFRTQAMALVTGPQPTPLVKRLVEELGGPHGHVAIIGVRQVSTVEGLRQYPNGRCESSMWTPRSKTAGGDTQSAMVSRWKPTTRSQVTTWSRTRYLSRNSPTRSSTTTAHSRRYTPSSTGPFTRGAAKAEATRSPSRETK